MYRTIQSPASIKADATVGEETGLRRTTLDPVLCCPFAALAVANVAPQVAPASHNIADVAADAAPGFAATQAAANHFAAAVMYVPPGRLSANSTPVSSSASVDELISTVRGDRTSA